MSAFDRWAAAGLEEATLPSGFRIRVLPVSPATLVLLDLAPTIVDEVLDARAEGSTDEAAAARVGHSALDIALKAVREVWDDETSAWEPVSLTAAKLAAMAFPPDDVEAIMEAALGRLTEREGEVSDEDLRAFRDRAARAVDRPDGGAVRPAPVAPRRARRATARSGARRGAGTPPGAG